MSVKVEEEFGMANQESLLEWAFQGIYERTIRHSIIKALPADRDACVGYAKLLNFD